MIMEHSKECLEYQAKTKATFDAWVIQWPNYCRSCQGSGLHTWTENGAPHGAGFWAMPMSELCSVCSEIGNCPRCSQPGLTSEDRGDNDTGSGPCKFCGWNEDDACPRETIDGPCLCEESTWGEW